MMNYVIINTAKPLCYISNKSLSNCSFPDKMIIVILIAMFKSDTTVLNLVISPKTEGGQILSHLCSRLVVPKKFD